MTLREHILAIPTNRILLRSAATELRRDELSKLTLNPGLHGSNVGIHVADAGLAIRALAKLDGVASQVVLLPASLPLGLVQDLALRSHCSVLLSDVAISSSLGNRIPVCRDIDELELYSQSLCNQVEETSWVIATSGTTGTPKLVAHSLRSLTRTTKTDHVRGGRQKWGLIYDYSRFAGLQVVLQSLISGAELLLPPYDAPFNERIMFLIANRCTHLSATPTLWRKILMIPDASSLPLEQVTLGGEVADDRVLKAASAKFPGARVSHIFASTEAGVGFSVSDCKAGFPEGLLTNPPIGISLRIVAGSLQVKNPFMDKTYLVGDGCIASDDGWVDTGDAVERRNGRVMFLGRRSGIINVGGDKVHPEEVERVLLEHPVVRAAKVYGKSNPITGALVAADLVLTKPMLDHKAAQREILEFLRDRLDRHKVPAFIRFVHEFQVSATGKVERSES